MYNATFLGTFTGHNYRPVEPHTSLPQAILAGIVIGCFALGVLGIAVGITC